MINDLNDLTLIISSVVLWLLLLNYFLSVISLCCTFSLLAAVVAVNLYFRSSFWLWKTFFDERLLLVRTLLQSGLKWKSSWTKS